MSTLKKCLLVMGLAGCAAGGVYKNHVRVRLDILGEPEGSAQILRENRVLASTMHLAVVVDRTDVASSCALLAQRNLLGSIPPGSELVEALCRVPGVEAAAVRLPGPAMINGLSSSRGAVVMLRLKAGAEPDQDTIRRLVVASSMPADPDFVAPFADPAPRKPSLGPDQIKVVDTTGKDLGPEYEYRNEKFYRNSSPVDSENYRLSAQIIVDEVLGAGTARVFAASPTGLRRRRREGQPGVRVLLAVEGPVADEQRDALLEQMRLRLNYTEKGGDSLTFGQLPYRLHQLSAEELESLQKAVATPPRPWSYSLLMSVLAFAPAAFAWLLISYDLLRQHRVRSSG